MPDLIGIEETKDVVNFALSLGEGFSNALKDGSIGLADIPGFIAAAAKLPAAISGIGQVPTELAHLDETEKTALLQYVKDNFKISEDKVEGAVLDGLALVSIIHGYVTKYFMTAESPPVA